MLLTIALWIWIAACVLALLQGVLLGLHTWEHRRFARRRLADQRPIDQTHRVALLAPCKGLDLELESPNYILKTKTAPTPGPSMDFKVKVKGYRH